MKTIEFEGEIFEVPDGFSYQIRKKENGTVIGTPFVSEVVFETFEDAKSKLEERLTQAIQMVQAFSAMGIPDVKPQGEMVH